CHTKPTRLPGDAIHHAEYSPHALGKSHIPRRLQRQHRAPISERLCQNLATPGPPDDPEWGPRARRGPCAVYCTESRMYTADAAGIQSYTPTWQRGSPKTAIAPLRLHHFPITPGTAAPGSRECFRCGVLTDPAHFGVRACREQNGREVPTREQSVRNFVGAIMFHRANELPPASLKSTRCRTTPSVVLTPTSPCTRRRTSREMEGNPPIEGWCDSLPKFPGKRYSTSLPAAILSLDAADQDTVAPFYQRAQLLGPNNAVVRVTAHVDNGATRNCISLARWKAYGHCLSPLVPSKTRLGVASGGKIWPYGQWWAASAWAEYTRRRGLKSSTVAHETVLQNEEMPGRDALEAMGARIEEIPAAEEPQAEERVVSEDTPETIEASAAEVEAEAAAVGRETEAMEAGVARIATETAVAEVDVDVVEAAGAQTEVDATDTEVGAGARETMVAGVEADTIEADVAVDPIEADVAGDTTVAEAAVDTTEAKVAEVIEATAAEAEADTKEPWVAEVEEERVLDAEEQWLHDELARIARKREKESARKAAQLERRAKQPLPFPGLGYSPPPGLSQNRTSRASFLSGSTISESHARSRGLEEEERQFEEEFVRISLIQEHAPWTETRFAKYLTVEDIPDADVPSVACDTVPEEPAIPGQCQGQHGCGDADGFSGGLATPAGPGRHGEMGT
ncbi:hypothetical protein B0H10DRAFT_1974282, partial [Mycena sp. CBHHK59/15]